MKQIEKHPAPEKLLQQITEEAINALALGGPDIRRLLFPVIGG